MPAPASRSTITSWPCATSSRTEAGVSPTRFSRTLISFGTPTRILVLRSHCDWSSISHTNRRRSNEMGHADSTVREAAAKRALSLDEYWMPFTANRDFKHDPKMVVRAEGMYYWNDRGEKIIDAASGLFCVAAGHCRKEISEAVHRQLGELDFVAPFLRGHPKSFELASRIAELTPEIGRAHV